MIAFRPAQKPILERLVYSTGFQIVALVLIVMTVFSFARHQRRLENQQRIADIENAQNTVVVGRRADEAAKSTFASNAPTKKAEAERAQPATGAPTSAQAGRAVNAAQVPTSTSSHAFAGGTASGDAALHAASAPNEDSRSMASAAGTGKGAQTLSITFAEVPRAFASDLAASADRRTASLQGSFNTGVVPNIGAKIKAAQGVIEQLDSSSRSIKANESVEFYGGQRDDQTGTFLGYVIEAVPTQIDENETHLQVRLFRYLRDPSGQPEEFAVPMPESLTIPRGAGAFVSGSFLLPRRNLTEQERTFYGPLKVLRVLTREEFIKGISDLVILIEPR